MAFAIKAEVRDPQAGAFAFAAQKTMYGSKPIAEGDMVFVFASENEGGHGLIARGVVTSAEAIAKKRGIARQTPRVSVTIKRTALAKRPLGRSELRHFTDWSDGNPATELSFKFYRQATNKIVGISDEVAMFLGEFFQPDRVRIRSPSPFMAHSGHSPFHRCRRQALSRIDLRGMPRLGPSERGTHAQSCCLHGCDDGRIGRAGRAKG